MHHETHLAAVDAHTERVRGYDHALSGAHESFLNGFAIGARQTGMIGGRLNTCPSQAGMNLFYIPPRSGIHDTERSPAGQFGDGANLFGVVGNFAYLEVKIRSIEPADDL